MYHQQDVAGVEQMKQRRRTDGPTLARDDDALLAAIQAHDEAALAALYDRYGGAAFGLAYRILGRRGATEDVVQEAFLNLWRHGARFELGRGSAGSWLMSMVHRLAIDRRRGRQRRAWTDGASDEVEALLSSENDDAFADAMQSIEANRVQTVLQALPDEQRQAIVLAYFRGLTHQEIADQTGAPLGTLKSRMRLGLRRMRALLDGSE
jgi:RNA polymerase sigma-70 factor (ECF subfamily)